jgi:hypothetical protein
MRSLLVRWGVAVVVGSLWGAILSPGRPATAGVKTTQLVSNAARCTQSHYAQSTRAVHEFASSGDNPMNL